MSNGVEVIVRGLKTALVGFEKTPWLPQKVTPSKPVTLPGHTVSKQFHLKDNPGKQANGIGQLLQSIVRSATPDLVTKTMLTTFTYKTTILKRTNTIIKSHEEVVSNIITQRFQSHIKVTPSPLQEISTTTLPPDLFVSHLATSPYITDTHTTTYIYQNTFTVGGLPMVLTSRETVSNAVTLPGYLPTERHPEPIRSTPTFETETHYSTYTFSKTLKDRSSEKVVTTRETVTQVIITEELVPVRTSLPVPTATNGITYFTTFTHLQTQLGSLGDLTVRTSTSVQSNVVKPEASFSRNRETTGLTTTLAQTKTLTPVLLYATKVFYTSYTYYTTVRHKDSTNGPAKIHSRTQVVSRVVTEALQTAFDVSYVNKLKSSYLSRHSTLLDVTSSVQEIIPTKTIDASEVEGVTTLVTQQVIHPHWPKDDERLSVEIEPSRIAPNFVEHHQQRPFSKPVLTRTPVISSSEEHFDEVKEGVHKIVSVLTDTKLPAKVNHINLKPSRTSEIDDFLLPRPTASINVIGEDDDTFLQEEEEVTQPNSDDFAEMSITELSLDDGDDALTLRPVSHVPTPPLRTSTERSEPTSKGPLKLKPYIIQNKIPIKDQNVELDLFPEIGPPPKKPVIVDYPPDYEGHEDDEPVVITPPAVTKSSSSSSLDKRKGSVTLISASSSFGGGIVSPTKEILSLISEMTDASEESDDNVTPPKIYNIPTTFDTEAFNQQEEDKKNNKTQNYGGQKIVNVTIPGISDDVPEEEEPVMETTPADSEEVTNSDEEEADPSSDDLTIVEDTIPSPSQSNDTSTTDVLASSETTSTNSTELADDDDDLDSDLITTPVSTGEDDVSNKNSSGEAELATILPTTLVEHEDLLAPEEETTGPSKLDELFTSEELAFISTGRPENKKKTTTRYTTSKRPTKKNKNKNRYPTNSALIPFSDEFDSGESSTNVYALAPVRFPSFSSPEESDEQQDKQDSKDKNNNSDEDDNSSESVETKNKNKKSAKKRPRQPRPPHQSSSSNNNNMNTFSGPSKSAISFPIAAGGGTAIATAATNAFNWKPLLNLGAIGLGGLGAFGTTKLGPLFNSVAGYMKGAILPISRNDTQHNNNNNNNNKNNNKMHNYYKHNPKKSTIGGGDKGLRRPYYQRPPNVDAPISQHAEHIYIPLKNENEAISNYRFSDGGIIRRPVITHAQEPNFRPLANGREPDFVAGPLPPPVHHHYPGGGDGGIEMPDFPPKHNYNFAPPHDNQPNIFTEQENGEYDNQPSLHKHGDPSPGPFLENNNQHQHHDENNNDENPEGKTDFILKPLHNLINGKPPFGNSNNQRPGWITPVLRPTHATGGGNNNYVNKPGPVRIPPGNQIKPIFKPRPGPASIEMINEIKDTISRPPPYNLDEPPPPPPPNSPQLFLPQRNHNKPNGNNNYGNRLPPAPQGPLRINIPGLNLHSDEVTNNELPTPWLPKTPAGHERYNENPFKDGQLNPPRIINNQNNNDQNENTAQAASHESFDSHGDDQRPFFNQQGFITRDHFNEIMANSSTRPRPQGPNNFNNGEPPAFMARPGMRPISPFHRPPLLMGEDSQHPNFGQQSPPKSYFNSNMGFPPRNELERFRPEDHQNRPPFKPIGESNEVIVYPPNFDSNRRPPPLPQPPQPPRQEYFDPPLFGGHQGGHSHEDTTRIRPTPPPPPALEDHFPPSRLPPWPNSGPGPGQLPGRFPSPMNIFDAPELVKDKNVVVNTNPTNIQRIVDPPHIMRRPPQLPPNPPSTVYIVEEELHKDDDFDSNFIKNHKTNPNLGNLNNHKNFSGGGSRERFTTSTSPTNNVQNKGYTFPKWKSTTPTTPTTTREVTTTTSSPTNNNSTTTNRALISRLFIRRFTTTTTTTTARPALPSSSTPFSTRVLPPWMSIKTKPPPPQSTTANPTTSPPKTSLPIFNTNLMNDLINFEEKFKQKYGVRKPSTLSSEASSYPTHAHDKPSLEQEDEELNVSIYSEEEEDGDPYQQNLHNHRDQDHASSTAGNGTDLDLDNDDVLHPNHHPIHKPPIDVTKYLKDVDEDEFGQLYQGTEDKDTVVDPVNQQIIKSPLDNSHTQRRNNLTLTPFMRRSTTTTTTTPEPTSESAEGGTTENTYQTLSVSEEEKILQKFTPPAHIEFTSNPPGGSNLWWPTTFRPKNNNRVMLIGQNFDTPTTYRPSSADNHNHNDIQPAASNGISSRRPFLALNPNNNKRPAPQGGMASFYDDEESMGQIKMKNSEIHKLPTYIKRPSPGLGIALVRPEEMQEYEKEISGEAGFDRGSEVGNIREKLNKVADKIKEYPEFPEDNASPEVGQDISIEIEKMTTKPVTDTKIQIVRPPPVKNQSTLVVVTTSSSRPTTGKHDKNNEGSSPEVQVHLGGQQDGIDPQNGNGHRESSYIYEEEYYDDDDDAKSGEGDDNGPPSGERRPSNGVTPQGKIVFFPKPKPTPSAAVVSLPPPPPPPFHHIAGHKVNNNQNNFQQQQRPPPPPPLPMHNLHHHPHIKNNLVLVPAPPPGTNRFPPVLLKNNNNNKPIPGTGLRIFQQNNGNGHLSNNIIHQFSQQQPNVPKTEMEPPPIDSNRLKPPILELPSSGPIRYRPNNERDGGGGSGGDNRPNLLRPDDDLFKNKSPPASPTPPIVHTIASVDDFNKIVGTNTFTAIIPTKSDTANEVTQSVSGNNLPESYDDDDDDDEGNDNLEGSEITVVVPPVSNPVEAGVTPVVKYTGGRLQTSVISLPAENSNEDEDDYYEETVTTTTTKPVISPTRSITTPQKTRGPSTPKNVTQSPPPAHTRGTTTSTTTTTMTSTVSNNASSSTGITRRPQLTQILRFTTTTKLPLASSTTTKPVIRRPFIPTRGPGPNIVPWARRPQTSSTTTTVKNPASSGESNTTTTTSGNKRPTSTSMTVLVSTSMSNSSSSSSSPESKRPSTSILPPFLRRPTPGQGSRGGNSGGVVSSEENKSGGSRVTTTLISRFVPTTTQRVSTTTSPKGTTGKASIFQNVTHPPPSIRTGGGSSTSGSDEYEEYSYEEEVTPTPLGNRDNATVSVVTQVSESINPTTRITSTVPTRGGGGPRWKVSGPVKPNLNEFNENVTVRYVTRSESVTVTLTTTETSSFTRNGHVQTETILITKTIPPQTLISTIAGSVTLVNTLDIQPTIVKTTVFSEPTRLPVATTFFDTSESSAPSPSGDRDRATSSTERVNLSGLVTKGKLRPTPTTARTPEISETAFSENLPCFANCTANANQNLACRTYANATRSRCDCKPGYARMKSKYPCRPTFTYEMRLGINHMDGMLFDFKDLYNAASDGYLNFITITKEAIDKAFLATDIKRQFQGSEVISIDPIRPANKSEPKVNVDFLVQLTTNITEDRIKNHLIRTLRTSNFSIGRTGVMSTRDFNDFAARDFNECENLEYNDCSESAECVNIRGSFSCKCKLGYKDKSSKRKPGRDCQETSGCGECNFRGTCHREPTTGNRTCNCFKWYGGTTCQINLKFLLIAITGIGSVLFILVMLCGTLLCKRGGNSGGVGSGRERSRRPERTGSGRFMRYRSPNSQTTLEQGSGGDMMAIMNDSASSDGGRQSPHNIITHSFTPDSLLIDVDPKVSGIPLPQPPHQGGHHSSSRHHSTSDVNLINFSLRNVVMDSDRGMAVVIPRAKIKTPSRPPSTHALNTSDHNLPDLASSTEKKLINYLDQTAACAAHSSKNNNLLLLQNEHHLRKLSLQEQRKISQGALVSSGEAVSAIGGMRRRSTTGLDPTEATYSAYTKSVSEVRSYDETIRCAAKPGTTYTTDTSRASCYSCKPPSYCAYSESHGHTMGDKDGASTVYTTQGKLFRMAHRHDEDDSSTASSQ